MYELSKKILANVSFDNVLFKKELLKALQWIREEEISLLQAWCIDTFGNTHRDIIHTVFQMNGGLSMSA